MRAELRVHPMNFTSGRSSEEWNRTVNALMGELISDLIKVKGAGSYKVVVRMDNSRLSDSVVIYVDASQGEPFVPHYPYSRDWEYAPRWANWWTASSLGITTWHESKPTFSAGYGEWQSDQRVARAGHVSIDIPVGIDWRTLCFERPESAVARLKMGTYTNDDPPPNEDSGRWGFLEGLKKFIP